MAAEETTFREDFADFTMNKVGVAGAVGIIVGSVATLEINNVLQHPAAANAASNTISVLTQQQAVIQQLEQVPGAKGNATVQTFLHHESALKEARISTLQSTTHPVNELEQGGSVVGMHGSGNICRLRGCNLGNASVAPSG